MPLEPPGTVGAPGPDALDALDADGAGAVLAFAEQCSLDVAAVTPDQRAAFLAAAGRASRGPGRRPVGGRRGAAHPGGPGRPVRCRDPGPSPGAGAPASTCGPRSTVSSGPCPALDALDPVTSELVRLRGARQHRCRLCMSIRSRPALVAGADEAMFDAVDHHGDSGLPPLARAALAFTDAMVWTPGRLDPAVVADLAREATPSQQVELVLDVTRNALNKVAVALGADAAHVEDGTEIYDVEPDGSLVYGLTLG